MALGLIHFKLTVPFWLACVLSAVLTVSLTLAMKGPVSTILVDHDRPQASSRRLKIYEFVALALAVICLLPVISVLRGSADTFFLATASLSATASALILPLAAALFAARAELLDTRHQLWLLYSELKEQLKDHVGFLAELTSEDQAAVSAAATAAPPHPEEVGREAIDVPRDGDGHRQETGQVGGTILSRPRWATLPPKEV